MIRIGCNGIAHNMKNERGQKLGSSIFYADPMKGTAFFERKTTNR